MTTGLFGAPAPDLATHAAFFGPLPQLAPAGALTRLLEESGLVGKGGGGFPAARKVDSVEGRRVVVIANGSEGEPLSRKDAVLLARAPHLVIDGLLLVAHETGSKDVYLYAGPDQLRSVQRALDERRADRRRERTVRLVESPQTFLAGEKSAAINRISGGPALPRDRVGHLGAAGLRGRPTLLHNVETLAHIALIARYGPQWFAARGVGGAAGTMLVTTSGDLGFSGVIEVPMGIGLDQLLSRHAQSDLAGLRAVLVGGFHGGWIDAEELSTTTLTSTSMGRLGLTPGAGIMHGLGRSRCGLQASADIVAYLAGQSARQCGPCVNGLPRLADSVAALALPRQRDASAFGAEESARRLAELVTSRGSCKHPDGTARFVRSTLRVFARDIRLHADGRCEANDLVAAGPRRTATR